MGDWMTITMAGAVAADQVEPLRARLRYWYAEPGQPEYDWSRFTPLSYNETRPGLCGIGEWPAETVQARGNLAERDYSVQDVADCLTELVQLAPSMTLKVHCGGPYESTTCTATITVAAGQVTLGPPEVAEVQPATEAEREMRLMINLLQP